MYPPAAGIEEVNMFMEDGGVSLVGWLATEHAVWRPGWEVAPMAARSMVNRMGNTGIICCKFHHSFWGTLSLPIFCVPSPTF